MKTEAVAPQQRWEDIVFENRNKEYGAYWLRKIYSKNLVIASILMLALVFLVFGYPQIAALFRSEMDLVKEAPKKLTTVNLDQPPPITPNQPPPPQLDVPPPIKTIKYVAPKVTKEEVREEEELPTQEELKQVEVSTQTVEGEAEVVFEEPVEEVVEVTDEDKIFVAVEQSAEFPGGMEALIKFLNKNIRYPSSARRMGVDGKVFISFVIDKEGKISDVQIMKGLNEDCDKEAIRLVQLMPDWKPGKQNGRPVRQKYVLPVTFRLQS